MAKKPWEIATEKAPKKPWEIAAEEKKSPDVSTEEFQQAFGQLPGGSSMPATRQQGPSKKPTDPLQASKEAAGMTLTGAPAIDKSKSLTDQPSTTEYYKSLQDRLAAISDKEAKQKTGTSGLDMGAVFTIGEQKPDTTPLTEDERVFMAEYETKEKRDSQIVDPLTTQTPDRTAVVNYLSYLNKKDPAGAQAILNDPNNRSLLKELDIYAGELGKEGEPNDLEQKRQSELLTKARIHEREVLQSELRDMNPRFNEYIKEVEQFTSDIRPDVAGQKAIQSEIDKYKNEDGTYRPLPPALYNKVQTFIAKEKENAIAVKQVQADVAEKMGITEADLQRTMMANQKRDDLNMALFATATPDEQSQLIIDPRFKEYKAEYDKIKAANGAREAMYQAAKEGDMPIAVAAKILIDEHFANPFKGTLAKMGTGILDIPKSLTANSEYGWTDKMFDFSEGLTDFTEGAWGRIESLDKPLFENGQVNWETLPSKLTETGTQMGGYVAGGALGGGLGIFTSGYLMQQGDNYREALAAGMTQEQARIASNLVSGVSSAMEMAVPDNLLFKGAVGSWKGSIFKALASAPRKEWKKLARESFEKEVLTGGLKEAFEEGAENTVTGLTKMAVNETLDGNYYQDPLKGSDMAESVVLGFLTGAGAKTVGYSTKVVSPTEVQAIVDVAGRPEALASVEEKVPGSSEFVQTVKQVYDATDGLPQDVRTEVTALEVEKKGLEEQQKALSVPNLVVEERIGEIDANLKEISDGQRPEQVPGEPTDKTKQGLGGKTPAEVKAEVVGSGVEVAKDGVVETETIKPIRQLGTGANVYFESDKYRVNDNMKEGGVLLNVGDANGEVPLANIQFDTPNEAVFVAKKLQEFRPEGLTNGYHDIDKIIVALREEYAKSTAPASDKKGAVEGVAGKETETQTGEPATALDKPKLSDRLRKAAEEINQPEDFGYEDVNEADTPEKLAKMYRAEQINPEGIDPIDNAISQVIGAVTKESFHRFGDRNKVTGPMARRWFKKDGQTLDQIAQSASEVFSGDYSDNSVTPEDVADFITKYPSGFNSSHPANNPRLKAIADKYKSITGKNLNKTAANSLLKNAAEKEEEVVRLDDMAADFIDENGEVDDAKMLESLENDKGYWTQFPFGLTDKQYEDAKQQAREKANQKRLSQSDEDSGVRGQSSRRSGEQEYQKGLEEIDARLAEAEKAQRKKFDSLSGKSELFAVKKTDELFEAEQSDDAITRAMKPYNDEVAAIQRERDAFIEGKENFVAAVQKRESSQISISDRLRSIARDINEGSGSLGSLNIIPKSVAAALNAIADLIDKYNDVKKALSEYFASKEWKDLSPDNKQAVKDKLKEQGVEGWEWEEEEPNVKETNGETKERLFVKNVREATDISDETKSAFMDSRTRYEVLPNEISVREATALVEAMGTDEAMKLVTSPSTQIRGAFRTTMAQQLIKALNKEKRYEESAEVVQSIAEMATDMGQAIQALSLFGYLTPEGQLLAAQREIDRQREQKFKQHGKRIRKVKKAIDDANKEAVEETVKRITGEVEKTVTSTPTRPKRGITYGSKNKVVTTTKYEEARKALRGKMFASVVPPPELIQIAAYHLEAGSRSFANFSKRMVEDFGKKVLPYLKASYEEAQKIIGGEGFDTDEQVESYLEKQLQKEIREGLKDLNVKIVDIIRKHFTEAEQTAKKLSEKLVEEAGLEGEEAAKLAGAVEREFKRQVEAKKRAAIDKLFNKTERKKPTYKRLQDRLVEQSNLGAISEAALKEEYAEALGFPKLTDENAKEITRLAEKVQATKEDSPARFRAVEDLLKYQAKIKGVSVLEIGQALWLASILSGWKTQALNVIANVYNAAPLASSALFENPRATRLILKGLLVGFKKGLLEGADVLRTGYSPIRGKTEVPTTLERVKFAGGSLNPANYAKFVRRFMVAADTFFFEGLKEMRAHEMAYEMAYATRKGGEPTKEIRQKALEILGRNHDAIVLADAEAKADYEESLANIESSSLTEKEKASARKQAKIDYRTNRYLQIEKNRGEDFIEESRAFAEKGTYNNPPEGALGFLSRWVNHLLWKKPIGRFVIPFVNVITNVANERLNYSPIGAVRAMRGGSITGWNKDLDKELSDREKRRLYYKAALGTMVALVGFLLTGDDDEEPILEITANGYNDFAKNEDLRKSGWRPYSFRVKKSDGTYGPWISYEYTPLAFTLSYVGNMRDFEKYRDAKFTDEFYTKAEVSAMGAARSVMEGTFINNAEGFLSATLDSKDETLSDNLAAWANKTASSMVAPNLITQTMQSYNDIMEIPDKEIRETYLGRIMRNIPVARDKYFNKVNGLGQELPSDIDIAVAMGETRDGDRLWQLLADKSTTTGQQSPRAVTVVDDDLSERFLTEQEYYAFSVLRGTYLRGVLENNFEVASATDKDIFKDVFNAQKGKATVKAKALIADMPTDENEMYKWLEEQKKTLMEPSEDPFTEKAKKVEEEKREVEIEKEVEKSLPEKIESYKSTHGGQEPSQFYIDRYIVPRVKRELEKSD